MPILASPANPTNRYRGRFAPSPSGLLHFGSLIAALGSYLQAKVNHGLWMVRIDDIDPPREQAGASKEILKTLEAYQLLWDEETFYQSQQSEIYEQVIAQLLKNEQAYFCQCSRKQIKATGGVYDGHCRSLSLPAESSALRLINSDPVVEFYDQHLGHLNFDQPFHKEDFIIKRRDGLYAYQLAVVIDDIQQGITEVVRGADLIDTTPKQIALYQQLQQSIPKYLHLPVAATKKGFKLSKQNHATPINHQEVKVTLLKAMEFLGLDVNPQLHDLSVEQLIQWAIKNWSLQTLPRHQEILIN